MAKHASELSGCMVEMDETELLAPSNGNVRTFDFIMRRADVPASDFWEQLQQDARTWLAEQQHSDTLGGLTVNRVTKSYALFPDGSDLISDNSGICDAIVETWTDSLDGVAAVLGGLRDRISGCVVSEASFSVVTDEAVVYDANRRS